MTLIKIGVIVNAEHAEAVLPKLIRYGFESFAVNFNTIPEEMSDEVVRRYADRVNHMLEGSDATVSCVCYYGNPLRYDVEGEIARKTWQTLLNNAHLFGTDLVTGFTGRIPDTPIDANIDRFQEVFSELSRLAEHQGMRIGFENCEMDGDWYKGDWNIAHHPVSWEMMFDAVSSDALGLEWEPGHQLWGLRDPIPQLRKWAHKVFHVHGKDATVAWDVVKEYGIHGPKRFVWGRTPGFGDSNWSDIITILMQSGYKGTIDIEGWHDPVYKNELEMTGQLRALHYLKQCRGGQFVPNPIESY